VFCARKSADFIMFAVIRTGGKQYKVAPNDVIRVERLPATAGAVVALDEVLMLGDGDGGLTVGTPLVAGACVGASVLAQGKGDKVLVFKKKRRKNYRRKKGHRQALTVLRITEILTEGRRPSQPAAAEPVEAAPAEAEAAAETPAKKPRKAPARKVAPKGEAAEAKPKAAAKKAAKPKAAKAKTSEE
jgi:large subunit ribosomal protein L21